MCIHESKNCPRCKAAFTGKPGNITRCQCYSVKLTEELSACIGQRYADVFAITVLGTYLWS